MDGTRAGRFARRGDDGRAGGLCTPASATLDTFALTRTLTFDGVGLGRFSSGCRESGERRGEDPTPISVCGGETRRLEDALPRRCRTNDAACDGVPAVSARCRDSGNGDVELFPFVRAVSLALTAEPAVEELVPVRDCGGLKGEGARAGTEVPRADGGVDTGGAGLPVRIVALLLTLAFGLTNGGDKDWAGCLKGEVGRGRS